ncbi:MULTISPECIES: type II toxin-antitoxin system RelB/DinJ family antitoxin [Gammaproteobacteria]|uniref:type II toxin-antitoxin system RelB/DinJ family antitoxin n=1 Tax=Gammaproteobacteria TaxID=1236 RepID=UPI001ADC41D3|nr:MULTISPECIES: type II toxin-antitoxin system RelB/DinJ family antitoxin [Gammaproteobacteria]MBO9482664.1 type II toxin-antitoxin system RelB/DinJ family antitoxin [Salinisphaera sp. G21_0]MBO9492803.1 type II toxin-antitoxin system RelB/DinJ family antitoxin [Thalassotalea sp. G20_0]
MRKSEVVKARIEPDVKEQAEAVFRQLGLNTTQAITLFYKQVGLCQGMPFDVRIPNDETIQALAESNAGTGLKEFNTLEDMLKDLDDE